MTTQNGKSASASNGRRRWRWLGGVLGGVLIAGLAYGTYWAQVGRYHQSTDDAYVSGNVVQITRRSPVPW
jgi:membrane fusion protein (multidrug efflux system)